MQKLPIDPLEYLKLKQKQREQFKQWKREPKLHYELYKKKNQPIINAVSDNKRELQALVEQNRNLMTELVPTVMQNLHVSSEKQFPKTVTEYSTIHIGRKLAKYLNERDKPAVFEI